jgi:hypothetical protein
VTPKGETTLIINRRTKVAVFPNTSAFEKLDKMESSGATLTQGPSTLFVGSTRRKIIRGENSRELRFENTVLSLLTSKEFALKFYAFSKRQDIAFVRGVLSAIGACFGFLALLKVTPEWTSFIYLAGLLPEILKLAVHVDVTAHSMLIREFEYIVVVFSGLLFASIMVYVLQDLRAVVPITILLVVLSSQAQDASIPFEQHKTSAAIYYAIGGAACIAVYVLIQFGFVPDLNENELVFGGANGKSVTINDVQFACDRLLTASFFLLKQAFVAYFYPDSFVTLREMITKRIVLGGDEPLANAQVANDPVNNV